MEAVITSVAPGSVSFTFEGKLYRIGSEAVLEAKSGEADYVLFSHSFEDVHDPGREVSFPADVKIRILNSLVRQLLERHFTVQIM